MVIGLTGGLASGKSTVAAMLLKANIPIIDADDLARELSKKNTATWQKIVETFGDAILAKDGELDRKKLATIVFAAPEKLAQLENILHPAIKALSSMRLSELAARGHAVAVYMAPLIFEKQMHQQFDKTLLITADRELLINRAQHRDQHSRTHVEQRLSAQLDEDQKIPLADVVIKNNGSLEELSENLYRAWEQLTGMKLQRLT